MRRLNANRIHQALASGLILFAAQLASGQQTAPSTPATPPAALAPIPTPAPQTASASRTSAAPGQTPQMQADSLTTPRQLQGEAVSLAAVTNLPSDALAPPLAPVPGVLADQVVGIINNDLVLESDVQEERRFEKFEPFSTARGTSRDAIIERLVDRQLILQQAKLQATPGVTPAEAEAQLQELRKDLPACRNVCDTQAGWEEFVHDQGFTMQELVDRWQQRMDILKFIELRFRAGIEITPAQIQTYYEKNMLPEYAKVHATPPKLAVISDRVQEVLLEQQVSSLLSDWLRSLKAEGSVRIMRPGEVQP